MAVLQDVVAGADWLKNFEEQLPGCSVAEIMAHATETCRSAPTPTNSKGPKLTGSDMKQMIVALNGPRWLLRRAGSSQNSPDFYDRLGGTDVETLIFALFCRSSVF